MKYISWNVNGIRAVIKKGFFDYLKEENPEVIGLQEIKANPSQLTQKDHQNLEDLGYHTFWNPADRPGYSGTAIFSKQKPLNTFTSFFNLCDDDNCLNFDDEGRILTAEFENHFFVTVYTPNSKDDLSRLDYREQEWDKAFLIFLKKLEEKKPVVVCGDFNVAHKEIDLARPAQNTRSAGFTIEERRGMDNYVNNGFLDTFRLKYPEELDKYTWWSYRGGARARNVGWRIDYFLVSKSLEKNIEDALIYDQTLGSDHCPVGIKINI